MFTIKVIKTFTQFSYYDEEKKKQLNDYLKQTQF